MKAKTFLILALALWVISILAVCTIDCIHQRERVQRIEVVVNEIRRDLASRIVGGVNIKYGQITLVDPKQIKYEEVSIK